MMRTITNRRLLHHIPIYKLFKITNQYPISSIIKFKVLKLFGQTKRTQIGLSKPCLEGKTPEKRSEGRQLMRWMDNIHKWTQFDIKQLNTLVKERESWRKLSHRDAQSAIGGESG